MFDPDILTRGTGFGAHAINSATSGFNQQITFTNAGQIIVNGQTFSTQWVNTQAPCSTVNGISFMGKVGIGTTCPQNELDVHGKIRAKEITVQYSGWWDSLLKGEIKRLSPEEKQKFILEYGHLPEIPSEEYLRKNGLPTGEILKGFQYNLEENTLDILDLINLVKAQQELINTLEKRLNLVEQKN